MAGELWDGTEAGGGPGLKLGGEGRSEVKEAGPSVIAAWLRNAGRTGGGGTTYEN